MSVINKVTTLYLAGQTITDEMIQDHIDEQNVDGYYLICIDNNVGWYRFFWAKDVL